LKEAQQAAVAADEVHPFGHAEARYLSKGSVELGFVGLWGYGLWG